MPNSALMLLFSSFWAFALLSSPAFSQLDNFFYTGFHSHTASEPPPSLTLNGVAEIQKDGIIRLTGNSLRRIGRAFYPSPLRFSNGSAFSFSTAFAFAIVPEYPKLGGHGFAFTISPSPEPRDALPSQYLGLLNSTDNGNFSNHIFAVEFDTVQDFEFRDIDDNHVGVDLNSLISNSSASATDIGITLKSGDAIQAWIDYDGGEKILNIFLALSSSKPNSPFLSFPVDLSPILAGQMFVGFSASTGLLASSHYLLGWSFQMNGDARSLDLASLPSLPKSNRRNASLAVLVPVGAAISAAVIAAVIFVARRRIQNAEVIEPWELEQGPHRFSYRELKLATGNFRDKELLGFGGFGRVYKGTLPDSGTVVAVKRISHESKQGLREFVTEIATIGRLRHRNLVQLHGWCRRHDDLMLVYDYMCNGSLDKILFNSPDSPVLAWEQRFSILRGVAAALLYLHEEWDQVVLHRDIKASNVLLDADMNGKLGDFGLARLYEHGARTNTTHVVGTLGYLAPELTRTGRATVASDMYAFGAVLLEVACGRRPIELKAMPEELILVDWVSDLWREGRALNAVDPRLAGKFDPAQAELVLKLGLLCSNSAARERPRTRDVVRYLDGEAVPPEVMEVLTGDYKAGRGNENFENFVHSYPSSSSSEKDVGRPFTFEPPVNSSANLLPPEAKLSLVMTHGNGSPLGHT